MQQPKLLRFSSECLTSPHLVLTTLLLYYLTLSPWYSKLILTCILTELIHKWVSMPDIIKNSDKWKVVIVGAGAAGICAAKRLKDVGIDDFVLLESADDVGGTWTFNTYPGVVCDVSSQVYSYSFSINVWWNRLCSRGSEIQAYLKNIVSQFELQSHVRCGENVTQAVWDPKSKLWTVTTVKGSKYVANVIIRATGALHEPHYPEFKNMSFFKKPMIHTARWDDTKDLTGLKVGVIGTGSSSVQLVPTVADKVKELYLFQRTPAWIWTRANIVYGDWFKYFLHLVPWLAVFYRCFSFVLFELFYYFLISENDMKRRVLVKMMRKDLNDNEELAEKLTPKYAPGCKRIAFTDNYLQAFLKSNVHLVQDPIEEFTPEGIKTKCGTNHELDLIVLATGFKILETYVPFECYGVGGKKLSETWGDSPRSHLGITTPGFPNMFILLGPSTLLGHNSVLFMVECQVTYILDSLKKLAEAKGGTAKAMDIRVEAMNKYNNWLESNLKSTAFESGCASWYNQGKKALAWPMWPKTCTEYWWATYSCTESDFEFQ